jgi:hypothetical protein
VSEKVNEPEIGAPALPPPDRLVITAGEGVSLIVAEYASIRAEILKLIELQAQLIALTVIAFGTVLSVGFQTNKAVIVMIYPLLALILGISWLNHAHAIHRCGDYIAHQIEPKVGVQLMGWESFVRVHPLPKAMIGYWGVRAIFIGSSALSVIAGTVIPKHGLTVWVFYCAAIGVTILTTLVFLIWREGRTFSAIPAASSSPVVLSPE